MSKRFESFEEFWPYYVREHKNKLTRRFHFVGTGMALGCAVGGLLTGRKSLLLLAPVMGYGPAWISHFFIEKNKPATFDYPTYSLLADFVMFAKMVNGTMDAEVERILAEEEVAAEEEPEIATNMATDGTLH
ncbi:MAG: Mpo1-like protein [Polyangiaceae bacterium]